VNYLDVGLKLDVEPTISLDNEVSMKVGLEVSNIVREIKSANGTLTYQVGTRNASTVLRLKDGETQALAGLISDEDRKSASKVPGLGDLPLLGHLFASHNDQKTKTEIVLLITPHIVRNIVRPEMAAMEFPSGTESSIGAPPLTLRKASPSEAHPATGATSSDKTSLPSATSAEGASKSATREPVASGPQPSAANTASPFVVAFAAPSSVAVGKDFVVTLNASANSGVAEVALDLVYDPSALAVESIQEGALMKQGGARTEFSAQPADGRARITIKRAGPEVRGSGALAIAKFKVLSRTPGTANISIEKLTALDAGGKETTTIVPARQVVTIVP
jgi:general secretion pathway protein D